MRPAMKLLGAAVLFFCALVLLVGDSDAAGGARTSRGRTQNTWPLVYHYDQAHTASIISTIHPPDEGDLARFIFDVNMPGAGAGNIVFGVKRYWEADGGSSAPICQITVPCEAPAHPDGGHIHSDEGFECGDGARIGEVAGELLTVEVLSQDCAGANTPEGNVTLYFEW